jgi:hypothetical protein
VVEDKTYEVTPAAMKVKVGIVTGEVTAMKVTERVEQGSGRVVSPAKLTANLYLKNSSADQTVRLVEGKIQYIDAAGQPIKLKVIGAAGAPNGAVATAQISASSAARPRDGMHFFVVRRRAMAKSLKPLHNT